MVERKCSKCDASMIYMDKHIELDTKIIWTEFECSKCKHSEKDYYKFSHTIDIVEE